VGGIHAFDFLEEIALIVVLVKMHKSKLLFLVFYAKREKANPCWLLFLQGAKEQILQGYSFCKRLQSKSLKVALFCEQKRQRS